jgi:hypothetical protein
MSIRQQLPSSGRASMAESTTAGAEALSFIGTFRYRTWTIGREAVIIGASIFLYFFVRGLMESRVGLAYDNAERIVALERKVGLFVEQDLQAQIAGHGWLVDIVNSIYIYGHWPVVIGTLTWLLFQHRTAYPMFRNALLISGSIGLVIFATFPVAPPRFLTDYGFIDTVTEQTNAYRVLQPPAFTNQYAAMPSLHLGWNLLMGVAWVTLSTNWWGRAFGVVLPILMFSAIVLTANHYICDGIAGVTLAMLGFVVARKVRRRPSTVAASISSSS